MMPPVWGPLLNQTPVVRSITVRSSSVFPTGSFTPTIIGQTTPGTQTYTEQYGRYMEGGGWFLIEGRVVLSNKDAAMAGNVNIGGLPFSTVNSGVNSGAIVVHSYDNVNLTAGYAQVGALSRSNLAALLIVESGDNVAAQAIGAAAIANNSGFAFGGWIRRA